MKIFKAEGIDKTTLKTVMVMKFYSENFETAMNYLLLYKNLKLDIVKNCKWELSIINKF